MKFTKKQAEVLYGIIARSDEFNVVMWYADVEIPYIGNIGDDEDKGKKNAALLLREIADALEGGRDETP